MPSSRSSLLRFFRARPRTGWLASAGLGVLLCACTSTQSTAQPRSPEPAPVTQTVATAALPTLTAALPSTPSDPSPRIATGESSAYPVLPQRVTQALGQAKVPLDAISVWVQDVEGKEPPRLAHRADVPSNPASVMKLVTSYAALDTLGPAYTWRTRVYLDGRLANQTLHGNLYLQGGGDPKLVMERLWLLLRELRQRGVQVIMGDIVLDHSAYSLPPHNPGEFDGEPLRPYNAAPDALLINFKSVVLQFVPDPAQGVARVLATPPMAHMQLPTSVPLQQGNGCPGQWRNNLKLQIDQPGAWQLLGSYPAGCGERQWAIAYPNPQAYAAKVVEGMWRELGGSVTGSVRQGNVPAGLRPLITEPSQSLTEIVRDVNKYSNNVMADHVFLAIGTGREREGTASYERSRQVVQQWWQSRLGNPASSLVVDNGSGLSRTGRVSAKALGTMLRHAWDSPVMPELLATLPVAGVDGTLRNSKAQADAHLKTGSLRDVGAIAGYVHGRSGKRYALVAIINHPNANAARSASFDALIDWVAND